MSGLERGPEDQQEEPSQQTGSVLQVCTCLLLVCNLQALFQPASRSAFQQLQLFIITAAYVNGDVINKENQQFVLSTVPLVCVACFHAGCVSDLEQHSPTGMWSSRGCQSLEKGLFLWILAGEPKAHQGLGSKESECGGQCSECQVVLDFRVRDAGEYGAALVKESTSHLTFRSNRTPWLPVYHL